VGPGPGERSRRLHPAPRSFELATGQAGPPRPRAAVTTVLTNGASGQGARRNSKAHHISLPADGVGALGRSPRPPGPSGGGLTGATLYHCPRHWRVYPERTPDRDQRQAPGSLVAPQLPEIARSVAGTRGAGVRRRRARFVQAPTPAASGAPRVFHHADRAPRRFTAVCPRDRLGSLPGRQSGNGRAVWTGTLGYVTRGGASCSLLRRTREHGGDVKGSDLDAQSPTCRRAADGRGPASRRARPGHLAAHAGVVGVVRLAPTAAVSGRHRVRSSRSGFQVNLRELAEVAVFGARGPRLEGRVGRPPAPFERQTRRRGRHLASRWWRFRVTAAVQRRRICWPGHLRIDNAVFVDGIGTSAIVGLLATRWAESGLRTAVAGRFAVRSRTRPRCEHHRRRIAREVGPKPRGPSARAGSVVSNGIDLHGRPALGEEDTEAERLDRGRSRLQIVDLQAGEVGGRPGPAVAAVDWPYP